MTGFPASEAKVYEFGEPHWLRGYKEIPVTQNTLEASNITFYHGGLDPMIVVLVKEENDEYNVVAVPVPGEPPPPVSVPLPPPIKAEICWSPVP